jgi:hypothetical protein
MKTKTLPLQNSINRSHSSFALLLVPLALAWFALSPAARAVDPPPDGDYGNFNTAEGLDALFNLDTFSSESNTAIGSSALYNSIDVIGNTAISAYALYSNTTGNANTATGEKALYSNTIGNANTADGDFALALNTTGDSNTATGHLTLYDNASGSDNTADGYEALTLNTTGNNNTATGFEALFNNTTGTNNTADGNSALFGNTTGSFNIAVGNNAGFSLTTGINNIDIGNPGVAGESKTIRIGKQLTQKNAYIAGISGATVPTGIPVIVDTNGHLGTSTSSARFKEAIEPMDNASEAILALKPVTFRYKHELDPSGIPQFGLVAEEVEKVNPDLVARDEQGKPYTVRYEAVNAMLLNEFLKEHRKVEQQESKIEQQAATIVQLQGQVEALAAGLQKVSARLELSKTAPQTVSR